MKLQHPILSKLSAAIVLAALTVVLFSACEPEQQRSYSFTVSKNGTALSGANVSIATSGQHYSVTSDNNGKCKITIPNIVDLPTFLIVNIDHSQIKPFALTVSGAIDAKSNKNIDCEAVPFDVKVRESGLHHLGNDQFGGSANSQLQNSAEGLERSFFFSLNSVPSSMPRLQIYARGVQEPTEIILNGITVDKLGNSDPDGDLSRWDFQLTANPNTVLKAGNNVLTIKTGANGSSDWDDIEFCGLLLYN